MSVCRQKEEETCRRWHTSGQCHRCQRCIVGTTAHCTTCSVPRYSQIAGRVSGPVAVTHKPPATMEAMPLIEAILIFNYKPTYYIYNQLYLSSPVANIFHCVTPQIFFFALTPQIFFFASGEEPRPHIHPLIPISGSSQVLPPGWRRLLCASSSATGAIGWPTTGTYNPNRQITSSTSRNAASVFHERKPHTWVTHVAHTCGASNVARQLVVVARSLGSDNPLPHPA